MKKYVIALLTVILIFAFSACSSAPSEDIQDKETVAQTLPTVIDTTEYLLYQNIFYNNQGDEYVGQTVSKEGVFTTLIDKYSNTIRYYVWGYNDYTKCCDWQWELSISDTADLPVNGSLVKITGVFNSSESSLDGYWIENPSITVLESYVKSEYDVDMTTMSGTLERVQLVNVQQFSDEFNDKTIRLYGRVNSNASIQHPYYDSVWTQEFKTDDSVPAIGTTVIVSGTYKDGIVTDSHIEQTDIF